jgi:uncharacterized cupredoxin-like copper-binding protein
LRSIPPSGVVAGGEIADKQGEMRLRTATLPPAARVALCLFACAIAPVGLSACSSGSSHSAAGTVVRVTVRDFHIKVSPARIPSGATRLVVVNKGPDTHELLVARTSGALPLRNDGLTVDEEELDPVIVATAEGEAPGAVEVIRMKLRPGRYRLFCNMAGHYLGGMSAQLVAL